MVGYADLSVCFFGIFYSGILTKSTSNNILSGLRELGSVVATIHEARVDSLKLVQDRQVLSGAMPLAGFQRLRDNLLRTEGALDFRIQGAVDGRQRPLLNVQIRGIVQLQCQRCLEVLDHAIAIDTAVRLVAPEALDSEHSDDPDEPDCVAASAAFDVAEFLEDEVLLALPAYPRHPAGQCASVAGDAAGVAGGQITAFSNLQALKPKLRQSKE